MAEQKHHVEEALASDLPVVVDAGALELLDHRSAPTLLTPHAGELARLLSRLRGDEVSREQVTSAPLAHAREAAERTGAERIAVVGGVAANSELRAALSDATAPPLALCTDNAAMIASAARYAEAIPPPRYLALDAYASAL